MRSNQHILPLLFAIFLLGAILVILVFEKDVLFPSPAIPGPSDQPPVSEQPTPDAPDTPDVPDTPDTPGIPVEPSGPSEPTEPSEPSEPPTIDPPTPPEPVVTIEPYTPSVDISVYLPSITYTYESHLLVNKSNPLGQSFAPMILKTLSTDLTLYEKDVQLEITAAAALEAMMLCMRADGITDTYVTSGFRSYNYQMDLQSAYIRDEKRKDPTLSDEQALAIVRTYSAAPGYSEHQTGLCVDLMTTAMSELNESFEDTEAFDWLQKNACHFGFILRYPKDKTDVTGYKYEPWHYRFVGRDAAITITEYDLTLEEYLAK